MRDLARRPIVLVALLLGLSATAPACRPTSARPSVSSASSSPPARSEPAERATGEELARYAERERSAAGLERFEGGRIDTGTIIIVLLLVIVIILIV